MGANNVAAPVSKSALSLKDIATVSRDLSILEQVIRNDYISEIQGMLQCTGTNGLHGNEEQQQQLIELIREVLTEATEEITPIIQSVWYETITNMKCSAPLSVVNGVAATYRMTNRPAPTRLPFSNLLRNLTPNSVPKSHLVLVVNGKKRLLRV